jgi:hypothetical protein
MIEKRSWSEFRKAGLLWLINSILHIFGWSIVFELSDESGPFNDDAEPAAVYPARVKYRGFSEKYNGEGYKKVSRYLCKNIEELVKEAENE